MENNIKEIYPNYSIVTLDYILSIDEHDLSHDTSTERTKLPAILLGVKKNDEKTTAREYIHSKATMFNRQSNKSFPYDRLFRFGAIGSSIGHVFVILTSSVAQSVSILSCCNDISVGQTVFILEPTFTGKSLSKDKNSIPIIETWKPLRPYFFHDFQQIPYNPTLTTAGTTNYFVYKNIDIAVHKLSMCEAHCAGILCDRQNVILTGKNCGCLYSPSSVPKVVLEMNIVLKNKTMSNVTTIPLPNLYELSNAEIIMKVTQFRSWKFTKLMLGNLHTLTRVLQYTSEEVEENLRKTINEAITVVNNNGGWLIIGWYQVGIQKDASDEGTKNDDDIMAATIAPHIVHLTPMDPNIQHYITTTMQFKLSIPTSI